MAATRNPTDIPFASNSVWNIGIGSNAQWSLNTDADARQLHGLHGTVNAGAWGQPIYFGTASDPLVTVTNTDPLYPVPPQQIHIPANALPAIGTDTHMAFYDATQPGKLWSYFYCKFVNGRDVTGGITTALGGVWDTTGDGITSKVFPGSNYNFAVGTITDYDVAQGAINHMVRIAISPDALKSPGATWTQNIPWPDTYEDYWGPQIYTGNIVAGSTFGIPKSVNLSSLGLSQGGMMLAKALQNYGGLWRDSGGSNQVIFYSTPENENNPLIQQMRADMAKIVPVMEIMRNQGPNSVNGGGTPVVPPLPPISLDGTTPPPVIVPPPPITFGTGPDSLVFQISEDAYANGDGTSDAKGDATFTVSVDGKQIGGTFTAAGSHAAGQEQTVTLNGYFGPGTHSVAVKFLNDAWGGTASTDRNLYVDSVKYQGVNINQSGSVSGTKSFSVTGGTSEPAPVPPPTSGQIVLTPTSGGSITDASGNVWTITPAGDIDENGVAIPGGGGSAALTYVASTHTVWAQDAASHGWYSWTNGWWIGPAATSPVGNPPLVDPTPITFGTGPDSLVFQISEDAYANGDGTSDAKGDATFTVSVDGKQIGGTFTAAGSHAAGQEQTVTLNGYFGPGTHSVAVKFLNDASGGTASTDRNLYVDSVKYQGVNINQSGSISGTKSFSVTGGTSEPPPVQPPTSGQIVLTPTSGGSITDASGNVWTITPAGDVDKNGVAIPGSGGSAALTYVASTHTVWAQDAASHGWYSWTNGWWIGPAATSPVGNPPVVDPPVVTPPATGTPRAQLLAYLQSISGTHALIGQTTYSDNNAFNADTQAFGFSPAIMFNDPWLRQWAGNAPYDASFMPAALAHAKAGGIVGMSLLLPNPVDHGPSQGGPAVDPVQLLTPGSALNASLNRELDQAAGLLQQFKDAGDAVLTRFMFELDGGWFWWGDGHFSNAQQTQLYRYIVNYLRVTKGLDNLLTTFAINGGPGDYQYPGDDVVDIVGIDAYTDNLAGYKGVYDKLISQAPTKLFALTEEGSGDPSAPDPSYDLTRLKADIQSALPRTVYANFWQNWGPNLQANGKAAMSDPFWINKSQCSVGLIVSVPDINFGTGPDSLVFQISEDAYANGDGTSDAKGDATFTVSVDGKQIGGTFTAAGSHAAGQEQTVTLNGYFGPGTHSVAVKFLNDASGGTASTDRNLYVDSVTYQGVNINQSGSVSGTKTFTISDGTLLPSITFHDEFDSLSLHRTWQLGDKWQLVAPDSADGRGGPTWGEGGSQWWVNPYNPNTPINDIYSVSNGTLNLGLLPTPSQYQSYIDQQAGARTPYVGALLNSSPTNDQHYGYWDIGMAVDRVPGFAFAISLENVQLTGHWPPEIDLGVSTDGSGKQTLQVHMYKDGGTSNDYSQPIDGTQQHDYGIDWEADYITFYLDNAKIFQAPNPGGYYQTDNMFAYLYTGANYSKGTGVNPPVSSLPAYAHIDYFKVYPALPIQFPTLSAGTGPDSLLLEVCDDAYANGDGTSNAKGDAAFTVSVDGKQIGGTFTTTASHAAGQDQDVQLNGYFGPGTHSVSVNFLNDAWGGTSSTDRNFYVDSITYNGVNTNQSGYLAGSGAKGFTVTGGTSEGITRTGTAGNDTLTGGAGAVTMIGGVGNDTYYVDNAADVVTENPGEGTDTVWASVNYALAAGTEVETLKVNATAGLTLTGNAYSHNLMGNVGNDTLIGGAGNDVLNGGGGADTMAGGAGNDTYFVDNAADVVTENVGGGTDTVWASVNYALATGTEAEALRANATTGLTLTGNAYSHNLLGNVGNDTLIGGAGNDVLNGGAGADTMAGGAGNDTYFVDNAADVVNENVGGGTDTVWAGVNYALATGTEAEALRANATTGLKLTGNAYSHTLVGNVGNDTLIGGSGNDVLNGGVGADTMAGGAGNDTYLVDNAADVVNEAVGQGTTDTVMASVNYSLTAGSEIEFLRANAGATSLSLTGNELANRLVGGTGNDTLDGGAGNDSLGGGAGNDIFRFLAGFGQDTITDFTTHAGAAGNRDLLDISGLGITAGTFAASVKIAGGPVGTTMVSFGGAANSIRLLNVAPASIDMSDFRLA